MFVDKDFALPAYLRNRNRALFCLWPICLLFASLAGCGFGGSATYPVSGKVVFTDGSPLTTGGQIIFESTKNDGATHHAMGIIAADGSFAIKMPNADGVLPGKYRCKLRGTADTSRSSVENRMPAIARIHPRFEQYSTSGLEFEVKPEKNFFEIQVEPPR